MQGAASATTSLVQLTTAIGYYSLLCMTVNTAELDAAPDAEVLKV